MRLSILTTSLMIGISSVSALASSVLTSAADPPQIITFSVKKFAYEPSEITLKKGKPVVLRLITQDVSHGIKIKEFNLNARIEKGKTANLTFTPAQTGDFIGHCSVFCGSGHGSMTLTLHVTE